MSLPSLSMPLPKGLSEDITVETRHDIYPTIDPTQSYASQSFAGKAVFITGASRGIGRTTAIVFAKAGAAVAIAARSAGALEETKKEVLKAAPEAKVESYVVDVKDTAQVQAAIDGAVKAFGRLDAVIANAGSVRRFEGTMDQEDAAAWWHTMEINVFGVYNAIRASAKYLRETNGSFFAVSSMAAQVRMPGASDYCTSKHAVNRLIEFIALENPGMKAFSMHPGNVPTQMNVDSGAQDLGIPAEETPELPAATMLYLAGGGADWLSGRYISATWDLGQVEREWKDKIVEKDLLVNKLDVHV
ncbi:NAD(P)-binding protein [Exidia glandulosa HHB12029]|uniref:NAD(P)-binding protein n=1 Tax=Exidia glandulosa HHB12029 TaxID=1314781 RepID=A0A166N793_EXIGL|nr:NAD(P)-binding protein [Exidia glandulosa HHB12029]